MVPASNPQPEPPPAPGTPGWWATRAAPPAGPRRGRPPRSLESIVAAAADLLDELGTATFSMRLLAERLNTGTATLYRHFAGKGELFAHVVDHQIGELLDADMDGTPGTDDWQKQARVTAVRMYEALSRHPHLLTLLVAQVPVGPNGLKMREGVLGRFVELGLSARLAARAYTTLAHYVIGFAMQQHAPGAPGPQEDAAVTAYYQRLDPDTYPHTISAAQALTELTPRDEFAEGLQFILDGMAHAHSQANQTRSNDSERRRVRPRTARP